MATGAMQALNERIVQVTQNVSPTLLSPSGRLRNPVPSIVARSLTSALNQAPQGGNYFFAAKVTLQNDEGHFATINNRCPTPGFPYITRRASLQRVRTIVGELNRCVAKWYQTSPSGKAKDVLDGAQNVSWFVVKVEAAVYRTNQTLGSYKPLPPALVVTRSLINPRVESNCFKACCVLHKWNLGKNKTRESKLRSYYPALRFSVETVEEIEQAMQSDAWAEMACNVAVWRWDGQPYLYKKFEAGYNSCMNVLDWEGHCVYISKPHIFLAGRKRPVCPNCLEPTGKDHACYQPDPVVVTKPISYRPKPRCQTWGVFDFESMVDGDHKAICYCISMNDGRRFQHFGLDAASHFVTTAMKLEATLFAHNAKGYDNSLIMQALIEMPDVPVSILSQSTQRVTGLTLGKTRLVDSLSFLGGSLNACLKDAGLECKLPYPYTYFKTIEDYDTPYCTIEDFDDVLTGSSISEEEWEAGRALYEKEGGWRGYTLAYCRWDCDGLLTLLQRMNEQLAVQDMAVQDYWTLPSLAYAMMLKMTKLKLQPLSSVDLYRFVERGMRGGITQVSTKRYSDKDLLYLDVNSLYPTVMKHYPLPNGVEWVEDMSINEDGLWEVDIEPTPQAWDDPTFLAMPHAPYLEDRGEGVRLICDMKPKTNYVETTRLLRFYTSTGLMRITKVHRRAKYTSFFSLGPFIDQCVALRKAHGDAYKLCMNSVFGKTCENSARYQSTRLVHDPAVFERLSTRLTNCVIFNTDTVLCMYTKKKALLKSPLQVGQAILSYSKLILYQMHRAVSRPGLTLLYTDTDSLVYECEREREVYLRALAAEPCLFHPGQSMMDYSNQRDGLRALADYKKVPGKLKDELPGKKVKEAVFLNPKCYCIAYEGAAMVKAKGVPRPTMKTLTLQDYKNVLFGQGRVSKEYVEIASTNFNLETRKRTKVVLSSAYSKRRCEGTHPFRTHPWDVCD